MGDELTTTKASHRDDQLTSPPKQA